MSTILGKFLRSNGQLFQALCFLTLLPVTAWGQKGKLEHLTVHGPSLTANRQGNSADRAVSVYLPPGYSRESDKRYPTLYLLHGIGDDQSVWTQGWAEEHAGFATISDLMDKGIAAGRFRAMIVVMPDAKTLFPGGFYTNSPASGNWEDFICKDLLAYIDQHYPTLTKAEARGIAGHSMGGYGALKLGMKHPDLFQVVYAMNPALLDWGGDVSAANPAFAKVYEIQSKEQVFKFGFYPAAIVGVSQAFSPNLEKEPLLADFPFAVVDGKLVPDEPGFSNWQRQFPLYMIEEYEQNLKRPRGYRLDSAFTDEFTHIPPSCKAFSDALTDKGIPHVFEMYNGDHRMRLWGRMGRLYTEVLPYFSDLLSPK